MNDKKILEWTENYSVGVRQFDEQHKRIIALINELAGLKSVSTKDEKFHKLIVQLFQYSTEHLAIEEQVLSENDYPEFDSHSDIHLQYSERIHDFMMKIMDGTPIYDDLMNYLLSWWQNHILKEDMKYKEFLNGKGIT